MAQHPTTPVDRPRVLTRDAAARVLLGWAAVLALTLATPALAEPLATPALWMLLAAVVAVILVCAAGVMTQAEHLAHRLGDPYGTIILTLSIVVIEVALIVAVMLGPGDHTTIARDSVVAVTFIILGLAFGVAAIILGMRHGGGRVHRDGASNYLVMIVVLVTIAFVLPGFLGEDGRYTAAQQVPVIVLSLVLYALFLWRQIGAQAGEFQEPGGTDESVHSGGPEGSGGAHGTGVRERLAGQGRAVLGHTVLLLATVAPIILLSHDMAVFLDDALNRAAAPAALSGVVIAAIVFLPETLTTLRAAWAGEAQRVLNLCHGAQVSTVGSTIPVVLTIGVFTGQDVVLAAEPTNLVLLALLLVLTGATFSARRIGAIHGITHVALFALFLLGVFA